MWVCINVDISVLTLTVLQLQVLEFLPANSISSRQF